MASPIFLYRIRYTSSQTEGNCRVAINGDGLEEKKLPVAGGGYMRAFPAFMLKRFFRN